MERSGENLERDERAEALLRFVSAAENIEPFHGRKLDEIFSSIESRRKFIESLKSQEFIQLLNGTNGILRGKEKNEWSIDGKDVLLKNGYWGHHVPPRQEDKLELLQEAFENAKEMNQNGRSLEDIALLVSASINEIHPYADANGRTSRLIYTLLTQGYNEESKKIIMNVLDKYGRSYVDINPDFISKKLQNIVASELNIEDADAVRIERGPHAKDLMSNWFRAEISEQQRSDLARLIKDDYHYIALALFLYIREHPNKDRYIKLINGENKNISLVSLENLMPDMKISDLEQIVENFWKLKKRYAEVLMDSIVNPRKPEYVTTEKGKETAIIDYFKGQIEQDKIKK